MEPTINDLTLVDDGTLDTVVECQGVEYRFSQEFAADYRDESGALDEKSFFTDVLDEIADDIATWDNPPDCY